jgi:hypothetical protein
MVSLLTEGVDMREFSFCRLIGFRSSEALLARHAGSPVEKKPKQRSTDLAKHMPTTSCLRREPRRASEAQSHCAAPSLLVPTTPSDRARADVEFPIPG